eukprot:SAG31_NODE_1864_length_7036_cov_3.477584_6_plen_204_part_00
MLSVDSLSPGSDADFRTEHPFPDAAGQVLGTGEQAQPAEQLDSTAAESLWAELMSSDGDGGSRPAKQQPMDSVPIAASGSGVGGALTGVGGAAGEQSDAGLLRVGQSPPQQAATASNVAVDGGLAGAVSAAGGGSSGQANVGNAAKLSISKSADGISTDTDVATCGGGSSSSSLSSAGSGVVGGSVSVAVRNLHRKRLSCIVY